MTGAGVMPGPTLQLVRAFHSHFNRTGAPLAESLHPTIEWRAAREDPDAATHRGLKAVRRYFHQWTEMFDGMQIERLEEIECGHRVFVWVRFRGKGTMSGVEIELRMAQVWTVLDGKAVGVDEYFERAEGLAAAGVLESAAPERDGS